MLYLDANILLRCLVDPLTDEGAEVQATATRLLAQIERNETIATFSEIVLQQVAYFLISPSQYGMPAREAIPRLRSIIGLNGMRFSDEDYSVFIRALALLEVRPSIGLADYLVLARCEYNGWDLATFDRKLARVAGVPVWGQSQTGDR